MDPYACPCKLRFAQQRNPAVARAEPSGSGGLNDVKIVTLGSMRCGQRLGRCESHFIPVQQLIEQLKAVGDRAGDTFLWTASLRGVTNDF